MSLPLHFPERHDLLLGLSVALVEARCLRGTYTFFPTRRLRIFNSWKLRKTIAPLWWVYSVTVALQRNFPLRSPNIYELAKQRRIFRHCFLAVSKHWDSPCIFPVNIFPKVKTRRLPYLHMIFSSLHQINWKRYRAISETCCCTYSIYVFKISINIHVFRHRGVLQNSGENHPGFSSKILLKSCSDRFAGLDILRPCEIPNLPSEEPPSTRFFLKSSWLFCTKNPSVLNLALPRLCSNLGLRLLWSCLALLWPRPDIHPSIHQLYLGNLIKPFSKPC